MMHGGDLTDAIAQFGGTTESWLDLSTGINPRPWPAPLVLKKGSNTLACVSCDMPQPVSETSSCT